MASHFSAEELGLPAHVPCVFCGRAAELHSPFGSQLSVATYWCLSCRTAFDWFRSGTQPAPGSTAETAPDSAQKCRK